MTPPPSPETGQPYPVMWKIAAGALIPALATIIFNAINFVFENLHKGAVPPVQESVYDFSAGCAFSLIGVCVAIKDRTTANKIFIVFSALLLIILGCQVAVVVWGMKKLVMIWIANIVSFVALSWSIYAAE
jgi:hypothetical protein